MKNIIRPQLLITILVACCVWLLSMPNRAILLATNLRATSTLSVQNTSKIRAGNVSALQLQKVIGKSSPIPNGHFPMGGVDLVFSPKGTYIVSDYNSKRTLQLWNVETGRRVALLPGHKTRVQQAVFTNDERFVATSDNDGVFRVWSLETFASKTININAGAQIVKYSIAASPNEDTFAVGNEGSQVTLVDAKTGNIKHILTGRKVSSLFTTTFVQFSPDGNSLVTISSQFLPQQQGTNAILTLWNLTAKQPILELTGDDCTDNFWASFSPEGSLLVASTSKSESYDCYTVDPFNIARINTVHIWSVSSLQYAASIPVYHVSDFFVNVRLSPDGYYLAISDNPVVIWHVPSKAPAKEIAEFDDYSNNLSVFNFDSSLLLTSRNLWEVSTGKNVTPWIRPENNGPLINDNLVLSAIFSADNTTIGLLMADSTIQIWRIQ